MERVAPLPAPPLAHVSFERLEYGIPCVSPDGPVEPNVMSHPLATSPGFSQLVEPFCRPSLVGIGADLIPGARHGTVLRCIRIQGRPVPLFCRLRQRPEEGEGAKGRRFWIGRYLHAGTVDPWTGFKALNERPLRGITVQEARASRWPPIAVPRCPRPEADPLFAGVLQTALEYLMSGIPVGIAKAPDEESFFRWASILWHLLPPPLQPVFSAGWAVTPTVGQALSFSWYPWSSPSLAKVDVERGTWTPPERVDLVLPQGDLRSRPFGDDLLVPGRMFLRESFEWPGGRARLEGAAPRLDHLAGFDFGIRGTAEEPASVADACSSWSFERFRRPGMRSLDHARLQLVETWLATGRGEPAALCLAARDYFFSDSQDRLFELGLGALQKTECRPRADLIVWRSLVDDPARREAFDGSELPFREASRAQLLRALAANDTRRILEALQRAQDVEGADDLPPAAQGRLREALTGSLADPASLRVHRALLEGPDVAHPYRSWAVESAEVLAVVLATSPDLSSIVALDRLRRIAGRPVIETLLRLRNAEPPAAGDLRALGSLAPAVAETLGLRLLALWRLRDPNIRSRRESLCPWMQAVGLLPAGDPLLALLASSARAELLAPEQRDVLAEEIRSDFIPPSLQVRAAALVLRHWLYFQEYLQDGGPSSGWIALLKHWPAEAVVALTDEAPLTVALREVADEVREALDHLALPSGFLDRRINTLLQRRKGAKLHGEAARLLWDLCARSCPTPGSAGIAGICRGLAHGVLPSEDPARPAEAELAAAAQLAKPYLEPLPAGLWECAARGWQIRLLLEASPQADLRPSVEQLVALLPYRTWLRRHLDRGEVHANRVRHLEIATWSFHQKIYDPMDWRAEYGSSPLWAAFRGVPLARQGSLHTALEAYAAGESHLTRSVVRNAVRYFEAVDLRALSKAEQRYILERLAGAVIAPLLQAGGLSPLDADPLIEAAGYNRNSRYRHRIEVRFQEDAFNALDFSEYGRVIIVADWFKPLLERIWQRQCQDEMVKAIRKVAPEVWRK